MGILEAESEEDVPLVGRTIAGKFEIESLLGSGSMGRVYRARHLQLEQTVALKVMSPRYAGEKTLVARFEREARASFAVAHPNIIRVIDYGRDPDDLVYLAMEFVEGGDLAGLIFRAAPLPARRIAHLMRQGLAGIAAAHDAGIIHRDLKPENLMLARVIGDDGNETEVVKVCDFGIARINDAATSSGTGEFVERGRRRLTEIGLIIGTPEYMPPEQARGEKVDARSDIYAMGVVLYEMLTGTLPFVANTPTETIIKQISEEPARPSAGRVGIDARLEEICLKALKKRAEDRFQSAREMRAAFDAAVGMRESNQEMAPLVEAPAPAAAPAVAPKPPSVSQVSARAVDAQATSAVMARPPAMSNGARAAYALGAVALLAVGGAAVASVIGSRPQPMPVSVSDDRLGRPEAPPGSPSPSTTVAAPRVAATSIATAAPQPGPPSVPTTTNVAVAPSRGIPAVAPALRPAVSTATRATAAAVPPVVEPTPTPAPPPVVMPAPEAPPPVAVIPPPTPTPAPAPPPPVVQAAPPPVDPSAARAVVTGVDNVQGALKRDVNVALSRASSHFVDCYQADVRAAASPASGSGTLHIETDDSGTVTSAHASVPISASGARCLERSVVGMKVPNVDTGTASADISISFSLH